MKGDIMEKDNKDFMSVLMDNNSKEMKKYLLMHGKKPKPISPFNFSKKTIKEENKNGNS